MNYFNHIPWDIVSLAVAVVVLGLILYLSVGKRIGIQVWKGGERPSMPSGSQNPVTPPPLPAHSPLSKEPTQYLLPPLGTEGAASLARAAEKQAGFSAEALLKEVEKTYRTIMAAYGEGKLERLQPLLGQTAFEIFKEDFEDRTKRKEALFCHLNMIESIKLLRVIQPPEMPVEDRDVSMRQRVEVEISSWQINGAKDASGHIVFGTQGLTHFCEKWLFEATGESSSWRAIAVEAV